ncbi:unnamed protein product, partial [Mesorhabditis spiculigera]
MRALICLLLLLICTSVAEADFDGGATWTAILRKFGEHLRAFCDTPRRNCRLTRDCHLWEKGGPYYNERWGK